MKILLVLGVLLALTSSMHLQLQPVKYAWYTYDEAPNQSRCGNDNQCDGLRICWTGWCQGTARPPKGPNYYYDESITNHNCDQRSPNKDYYCDGKRTCSYNAYCQGTSRP